LPDGAVNAVPAGYSGTPFTTNAIPGFVYTANYDKGGSGVAYCHAAANLNGAAPTAANCGTPKLNDWCCGTQKGCDQRNQPTLCPVYRADNDNAGLSHMNLGEVDAYALAGPTWVAGATGPTLTGPAVTVGMPVPQHANMTTQDDAYISYMYTGQWSKYTVEVLAAGTYAVGGFFGAPGGTAFTLDFGNGISTGMITIAQGSPVSAACRCVEAYHAWTPFAMLGQVTFPAAGTYVMTFTLNKLQFNPLYFTFTKM
jgi:hypothetical protein